MGAHAAMGAYLTRGLVPYVDVIDNKQPLPYLLYAVVAALRPYSVAAIRLSAMVVAAATVLTVVLFGRRLMGLPRAVAAGMLVAVVGASRWVQGVDLNTEHLLAFTGALAVLVPLAVPARRSRTWVLICGFLVGLAALSKAPGALLAAPALVALLWRDQERGNESVVRTVSWFVAGATLAGLPFLAWYAVIGELDSFLYWNVVYNVAYSGAVDVPWWRWILPAQQVWPVATLGAGGAAIVSLRIANGRRDRVAMTLVTWLAAAYIGARIGQRDFPHYYAPLVVPAALGLLLPSSRVAHSARRLTGALATAATVAALFATDVVGQFGHTGDELVVRLYRISQARPWIWHEEVGAYLREHSDPGDELYVVGNEPGFYWSSGLAPASPHIVSFPGEVLRDFDDSVAADLAADPPDYVVQPYGGNLWPPPAAPLEELGYVKVAAFGPVSVLSRQPE